MQNHISLVELNPCSYRFDDSKVKKKKTSVFELFEGIYSVDMSTGQSKISNII